MLTACPSDDELYAHAQGQERNPQIEAHLLSCRECTAAIAEALRGLASMQQLEKTAPGERATPIVADAILKPGARLGRYLILEQLGKGSMGAVYAAHDPQLDRRVAIKVLRPDARARANEKELQARLLREAQAMARLAHPNVVAVHDVGDLGEQVFVAMDLIDGTTLRRWLDEKPRGWREVLTAYLHAGRGLEAAHLAGLVHRDFKPDNVLVGRDGRTMVTDFGLARYSSDGTEPSLGTPPTPPALPIAGGTLTPFDVTPGTPAYMSPEQMQGKGADARSDLFAFCTALYEGVAGVRPYPGMTIRELQRSAERGAPQAAVREAPGWLLRELRRGLSAEPSKRQPSMTALLSALEKGLAFRRREGIFALVALAIIAALSIFLVWRGRDRSTPHNRQAALLFAQGIARLRSLDPAGALPLLEQAAKIEPDNPRIDAALTEAAERTGHRALAAEAAARAYARRIELPESEAARLSIVRAETQNALELAITLARADWEKEPGDAERGLLLAEAQRREGKYTDALATAVEVRKLPKLTPIEELALEQAEAESLAHNGKFREALEKTASAEAAARSLGLQRELGCLLYIEGVAERKAGEDLPLAKKNLEESAKLLTAAGDRSCAANPLTTLAAMQADAGDLAGARAQMQSLVALYQEMGDGLSEARMMHNLAVVARRMGDEKGAIQTEVRALTLLLDGHEKQSGAASLQTLGQLRQDVGDLPSAAESVERAVAIHRELKSARLRDSLVSLASIRFEQGQLAEAHKLLGEAHAVTAPPDKTEAADELHLAARLAQFEQRYADAEKAARDCSRLAEEAGDASLTAACDESLAEALLREKQVAEARAAIERARAVATGMKNPELTDNLSRVDALVTAAEWPKEPARAIAILQPALEKSERATVAHDRWALKIALASLQPGAEKSLNELARQATHQDFALTALEAEQAIDALHAHAKSR